MTALTIGLASNNDFEGTYATLQALRWYQDLEDVELLVVDTHGCKLTKSFVVDSGKARYHLAKNVAGSSAARNVLFQAARGDAVLCIDPHVMLPTGTVSRLKAYYRDHPGCSDLLQGPAVDDDLKSISTHLEPIWRGETWGIRQTDRRGLDPEATPFEIPMQDMGLFSCRRDAWPGFNPAFRGVGWEEGYIHEKIRRAGGRSLCLPWLRWNRRCNGTVRVTTSPCSEDTLRNYLTGFVELGWDPAPVPQHFAGVLSPEEIAQIESQTLAAGISAPPRERAIEPERSVHQVSAPSPDIEALPLISCICTTFNRPPSHQHLVEEAIESFLRQTYPNKELIVMNDCPGQELVCDAPGVRMVNVPERFASWGEKLNAAIALSRGKFIAPWDDDDIGLPSRLAVSIHKLGQADYFNPKRFWVWESQGLHPQPSTNVGHNLSLFRRSAFETVKGYPSRSFGIDVDIDRQLRTRVACVGEPIGSQQDLADNELFYIYRWGVSPTHLSSAGADEQYQHIGARPIETGRFILQPHWRTDYTVAIGQLLGDQRAGVTLWPIHQ